MKDENGLDWAECPRCRMGCVIPSLSPNWWKPDEDPEPPLCPTVESWLDKHECPEPFPRETAEFLAAFHSGPNAPPISLRTRARIILGLADRDENATETHENA